MRIPQNHKELHNNDIRVNHKTVRKLMKQLGLVCQVRSKGSTVLTKAKLEK
ncbi:MAG: transposase [Subdoligranulum sp.]|nr:transposase [Subdoligranulum sp.]